MYLNAPPPRSRLKIPFYARACPSSFVVPRQQASPQNSTSTPSTLVCFVVIIYLHLLAAEVLAI